MTWKTESQRKQYGRALVELGKERSDIVVLDADLSSSTRTSDFAATFPERFFNVGIAEQNMMDTAAGLAASGKTVFASTFAVFGTGRCYDQIRQSIAYPQLNIKIVASHAGITVGGDGASHQIIEDIALMRVLPNMTVIVPVDSVETYKVIKAIAKTKGPVYVRMGRADVPTLTDENATFEMKNASVMRDGEDVTLIGCGIMVSRCLEAAEELAKHGVDARVINLHTIKPLDEKTIVKAARETGGVVTAEEHSVIMGMGSAVALCLVENFHVPMKRVGIPDTFGESGSCNELMEKYGLTVEHIVEAAHDVLKRKK
ncbi:MAG: transketolase family protein [Thermoplasmata archaeon]|nr:transketolase family protein [Thermoplasmata archaeon]MBU1158687.1 transketolase family protein [Candidatus Thermoplasmatota archaeon]TFG71091.1 MAG: transketolase family protein [Methanomassiliicoccus sp.]